MPRKDSAAKRFEERLVALASGTEIDQESALRPFQVLFRLFDELGGPNDDAARSMFRDLHLIYQWVRSRDDNWSNPKKPKRVFTLKREYVPEKLAYTYGLAKAIWPFMPLVSFLYDAMRSQLPLETVSARMHEYMFVVMCTKPKVMRPWIYALALEVVARNTGRFDGLDSVAAAQAVADTFERRASAVSRYQARASSVEEAANRVRKYVAGAIRRRLNGVVRGQLDPAVDVPSSTASRWRRNGITIRNPDDAERVRREMRERQTHFPEGRFSLSALAQHLKRARSTTDEALQVAKKRYGFVEQRGPDKTMFLTPEQVRWVRDCLPAPRKTRQR